MTRTYQCLTQICNCHPTWHYTEVEYLCIADIGSEILNFAENEIEKETLKKVFSLIEVFLEEENIEINSLIIAGMFGRMQTEAYSIMKKPNKIEKLLGERALKAWGDYIEGHLGIKGIRTIEDWRRIIIQKGIEINNLKFHLFDIKKSYEFNSNQLKNLDISPLLAHKIIQWNTKEFDRKGFDNPYAILSYNYIVDSSNIINNELIIGNKISSNNELRYLKYRNKIAEIDIQSIKQKLNI